MLRTERSAAVFSPASVDAPHTLARDLLIAVAPPPRTHVYDLTGWPQWLTPPSGPEASASARAPAKGCGAHEGRSSVAHDAKAPAEFPAPRGSDFFFDLSGNVNGPVLEP